MIGPEKRDRDRHRPGLAQARPGGPSSSRVRV